MEKIKTIGDAYMVAGGIPLPRADRVEAIAELALAMGPQLADCAAETELSLQVRIGIDSGRVVAGVIGRAKFSYDLWGDTRQHRQPHGVKRAARHDPGDRAGL